MERLFRALFAVAALAWAPAVFAENVTEQKILKHMNEIEVFEMMTESALFVTEGQTGEKDRHAYFLYMSPQGRVERSSTVRVWEVLAILDRKTGKGKYCRKYREYDLGELRARTLKEFWFDAQGKPTDDEGNAEAWDFISPGTVGARMHQLAVTPPEQWKYDEEAKRQAELHAISIISRLEDWKKTPAPRPNRMTQAGQILLNRLGYRAGNADGIMGKKTKAAFASYLSDRNLPYAASITEQHVRRMLGELGEIL